MIDNNGYGYVDGPLKFSSRVNGQRSHTPIRCILEGHMIYVRIEEAGSRYVI